MSNQSTYIATYLVVRVDVITILPVYQLLIYLPTLTSNFHYSHHLKSIRNQTYTYVPNLLTTGSPVIITMLSLYLQSESQRWAAEHHQSYPASTSPDDSTTITGSSYYEDSDTESIFSRSPRSRRSSISSIASEDAVAPVAFEPPRDFNGAPITMYASLDQAVTQSTERAEAQTPRRLVTPGKLYENEEDDDEIIEMDEEDQKHENNMAAEHNHHYQQHHGSSGGGIAHATNATTAAVG